eukprot:scaffold265877_cov32-Tisochrysis_lutea.AAC.2
MWPGIFPHNDSQRVAFYDERLLVGYRWYDAKSVAPAFPFGYGLSFTTFTLSKLTASANAISVTVTNTGRVAGRAVPQLYLGFPPQAGEPPQQLRGFHKTAVLYPGEMETCTFELVPRDRSIWDVEKHEWAEVKGVYHVIVGFSSRCPQALKAIFSLE